MWGCERNDTTLKLKGQQTRVSHWRYRVTALKNLHVEGSINLACEAEPYAGVCASKRLHILVAKPTASLLQDATLASLFHSYRVEFFDKPLGLFVARASPVTHALLCSSGGCSLLSAEAYIIRKQWPFAKIVMLGPVPHDLDDHLYDDMVELDCSPAAFATVFCNRSIDRWDRPISSSPGQPEPSPTPDESDPTKAEPSDLPQPPSAKPRDLPADERQDIGRGVLSAPASCHKREARQDAT